MLTRPYYVRCVWTLLASVPMQNSLSRWNKTAVRRLNCIMGIHSPVRLLYIESPDTTTWLFIRNPDLLQTFALNGTVVPNSYIIVEYIMKGWHRSNPLPEGKVTYLSDIIIVFYYMTNWIAVVYLGIICSRYPWLDICSKWQNSNCFQRGWASLYPQNSNIFSQSITAASMPRIFLTFHMFSFSFPRNNL